MKKISPMWIQWTILSLLNILLPLVVQINTHQEVKAVYYIQTLINITSFLLVLNKKISGVYIYFITLVISIILDLQTGIYGDAILRFFWMFPMNAKMIFEYYKNKKSSGEISYHIWEKKEAIIAITLMIALILFISYDLNYINKIPILNLIFRKNDPFILLDSISVVANILSFYQFSKLHRSWYIFNIFADLPLFFIWISMYVFKHNSGGLVVAIGYISFASSSLYGWIRDFKEDKKREIINGGVN